MTKHEPVIGLEIHIELNTKSKMFCRCSADYFGKKPNTHACPVCLGLPGSLPYANREALKKCLQIGLALNCQISEKSLFERKNYFYPDLPKGYQISQYRWPLCLNGWIKIEGKGGKKKIRINRVHQEEDTGKLTHVNGETLIDFNRSGVPLVEIVTEPDFIDTVQIKNYARKIQQICRYLGVSNADMEKGDMRLEANISVRPVGEKKLPSYRIELKNINSFRFMVSAIEYEIQRQIEALEKGEKLTQETRGWNENKKQTYSQRTKEEAHDYRYFPEPDLPPLVFKEEDVDKLQSEMPELPEAKLNRFTNVYNLNPDQARILTESLALADYFEETVKNGMNKISAGEIASFLINRKIDLQKISPPVFIAEMLNKKTESIKDVEILEKLADEVIAENENLFADYRSGKTQVLQALIGTVMKKSSGRADPQKVRQILEEKLKK